MDLPGDFKNMLNNLGSDKQTGLKPYHVPQLTEWGELQELTRGGAGALLDSKSFAASNVHGSPIRPGALGSNSNFPSSGPNP